MSMDYLHEIAVTDPRRLASSMKCRSNNGQTRCQSGLVHECEKIYARACEEDLKTR